MWLRLRKSPHCLPAFFCSHEMQFPVRAMSLNRHDSVDAASYSSCQVLSLKIWLIWLQGQSLGFSKEAFKNFVSICLNVSHSFPMGLYKATLPATERPIQGFFPAKPQASLENIYKSSRGCKSHTPLTACKAALARLFLILD